MWPRICEAALSLWLLFSPSIFDGSTQTHTIARMAALAMLAASLISLIDRFRRAYLVTLLVSLLIAGWALIQSYPASPMIQNVLLTALVIAMFAIMPPEATRPPRGWRQLDHE